MENCPRIILGCQVKKEDILLVIALNTVYNVLQFAMQCRVCL